MNIPLFSIILLTIYPATYSEWISHLENTMPRDDTMSAIGSYNDSIYLLGGFTNPRQQTIYDINLDSFVLYRSAFVSHSNKVFGEAQYWTQIKFNLYILDDLDTHNNKITVFNMKNNSFNSNFVIIPEPVSDGMGRACVTSSSFYNSLFINGGINHTGIAMKETYVLNIQTMNWNVTTQMQTARSSHSCLIHSNNKLYSIGGKSINSLTATIEKISIDNIHENKWIYLNGALTNPTKGLRSFISGNYIIICGGFINTYHVIDTIHVIDTTTETVKIVTNMTMAFATAYSAVAMVNNIMYSFGGRFGINHWQSCVLSMPTTAPTNNVTRAPTLTISNFTTTHIVEGDSPKGGFAMGNVVGIGFAIAFMVCLLLVVIVFVCRFYRRDNFKRVALDDDKIEIGNNSVHSVDHSDKDMDHVEVNDNVRGNFNSSMALMNNDC